MNKTQLAQMLTHAESLCKKRGSRLTAQRKNVLRLVCEAGKPLSAYEILDLMRATEKKPAPRNARPWLLRCRVSFRWFGGGWLLETASDN